VPSARPWKVATAVLAFAVVAGAVGWVASRAAPPRRTGATSEDASVVRFQVAPPLLVNSSFSGFREFAVHPDGTAFAYSTTNGEIQLHDLSTGESRPIAGAGGAQPFFSADGKSLGFFSFFEQSVFKVPVAGGLRQRICPISFGENLAGFAWRGDWIVFALVEGPWRGLWKTRANGGERERLGEDSRLANGMHPSFLPDSDAVLFSGRDDDASTVQRLRVVELASGVVTDLGIEGRTPQYLDSGDLVFGRDDGLWAVRFDADRMRAIGDAWPVLGMPTAGPMTAFFSTSRQGTLVALNPAWHDLVEIGLDGARRKLAEAPTWMHMARYSPDGARVAYTRGGHGALDIWIHEVASGRDSRLGGSWCQVWPVWTSRGDLVYTDCSKRRFRMMLAPIDRRTEPQVILEDDDWLVPTSASRSGIVLLGYHDVIGRLDLAHPGSAEVWLNENVFDPVFSPDGRWVAYTDGSDGFKVFIRPYPGPGGARLASIVSGYFPTWSADGTLIYFEGGAGGVDAVPVNVVGNELVAGTSRVVLEEFDTEAMRNYDTKPVGTGFVKTERRKDLSSFNVVLHFDRLIEQRRGASAPGP
jgi:hypothetical protein